jgi:hypothetical protein
MEDMKVIATGYDFRPAHAVMQRYVDGNILSGFSFAVLVGRDLVGVKSVRELRNILLNPIIQLEVAFFK